MPGLSRRREALRGGDDWSKSKKSYAGGGMVMEEQAYGHGGKVMDEQAYGGGGSVKYKKNKNKKR
jgi:hypothetical protein